MFKKLKLSKAVEKWKHIEEWEKLELNFSSALRLSVASSVLHIHASF